jgi:creatinine amidohydrolase
MKPVLAVCAILLSAATLPAQTPAAASAGQSMGGGQCERNAYNCADAPNPLPAPKTVWLEEMTWMDVRDALKAGKTTVIIATGGMEPNGPWLVTGKHNYVLKANCEAIARKLGNALCAPIIKLVPEGRIEPQSSHMVSPGTISLREETFRAMLTDVVHSLKMHGFKNIILIGDSGGNQAGQRAVADSLTGSWKGDPVVAHIQEYYDYAGVARYMGKNGIVDSCRENLHDDPVITLNMFITDPSSVRYDERVKAGKATINGVSLADRKKATELAKAIVDFRATSTVDAINKAIANKGTLPAPARSGGAGRQGGGGGGAGAAGGEPAVAGGLPACK